MALTILLHGDPRAVQQARLGAALVARGHRVIVCDAPLIAARIREHGRCEELALPRLPDALRTWWVRRQTRALGVDVVHLNFIRPWHVLWSRMRGGPPYVATAWGSDLNDEVFRKTARARRRIDHVLAHASAITADTAPLLARACTRAAAGRAGDEVPSRIVLWGVDVSAFERDRARAAQERWRRELGLVAGERVVLSPRQTKPHYFVDRILRAFADSRWANQGVLLVKLYGRKEEEPTRAQLEAIAAELGIRDRLRFVPPCSYEDLAGLYALADAAVSALEIDGMPSTFCELLSLGVPLVATDLPAYRGALSDGDNALLVRPGDHGALTAALDRLASEPSLRERLGQRGRAWAEAAADWERCVDAFEAAYRDALAPSRAGQGALTRVSPFR